MDLLPGDIAACYGTDPTSLMIRVMTGSLWPRTPRRLRLPPSHVALIAPYPESLPGIGGPVGWWESTSLCHHRCRLTDRQTSGIQLHPPALRIRDYVAAGGRVTIYRLADGWELSDQDAAFLKTSLTHWVGRGTPYDRRGAAFSGTRLLQSLMGFIPNGDLASQFCSELVADRLMRINRLNHDNPQRFNPGRLLRRLVWQGKYAPVHEYSRLAHLHGDVAPAQLQIHRGAA